MGRKKKIEEERTCANCAYGPRGRGNDCDICNDLDAWQPKEPECDGDSCTISVNGAPPVPFPSKEAAEQVTEMVDDRLKNQVEIARAGVEELERIRKNNSLQLDLDMKPAEYPVGVDVEDYRVLTFECGSWTLKVREDRLERAAEDDKILALVQRRLKASGDMYPLVEGEFDRWVQRFSRSLTNYVRTGCS